MKLLVFAVIILHIFVSPILISISATVDTDSRYAKLVVKLFFIPVFFKTVDLNIIKSKIEEKQSEEKGDDGKSNKALKRYLFRVAKSFLSRIRFRVVDLSGIMGSGDAAVTAVAVGSICAGYDSARAVIGFDGECNVRCEYDYERIYLDFYCIISFCLADTIYALIAAALVRPTAKIIGRKVYG